MITTVVFDLDDTLYDEIEYCKSGFASVAEFLANLPDTPAGNCIFDCLWKQFTSGNRKRTFNAALDELGISYDDKLIAELIEVYRNHIPEIALPQDSRDVLRHLSSRYTLAILTDGFLPAQRLKVRALGIEKYFKYIIYTEELGRDCWKPSPTGFEKLMQTLNSKPEAIVYVADNEEKDFIAPNKLGFLTVQLIRSGRIHTSTPLENRREKSLTGSTSERTDAKAQFVIHKISELPPLLEKAGAK